MNIIDMIKNNISNTITIISVIVTVISLYFPIKQKYIDWKERKTISWKEINNIGIPCLAKKVTELEPDVIVTLSGRGGIVTNLVITELNNKYPVYTCILKNRIQKTFYKPQDWKMIRTSKWNIFLCPNIYNMLYKRILIMDDITSSGETIEEIIKELVKNGISMDNIFSMALVADKETHKNKHIPDFYYKIVNIDEYTVPWGKTIINNH